ncbi:MAG: ferrous iron transporter B [Clostridia bacterium]|nr:ferrous iron transporter B [Clostridia bacterium]
MIKIKKIALLGNPNVGKSTIFNALTGMHQHTGNWTGKTVETAKGYFFCNNNNKYEITDLPGTYSLYSHSRDEEVATDYIVNQKPDLTVIVADATNLERNFYLVFQALELTKNILLCITLTDEAKRKGIEINTQIIAETLGIPVISVCGRKKKTIIELKKSIDSFSYSVTEEKGELTAKKAWQAVLESEKLYEKCVKITNENYNKKDRKTDSILTSKLFGFPVMLAFTALIFYITLKGANYPSKLLSDFFNSATDEIRFFFEYFKLPEAIVNMLVDGVYKTLTWVIAVMLPPMAIFFPLFTLMEDLGYLPRIAFNLDNCFKKCGSCGKQALTMCMGLGCNAVGVTGTRIISSERERLIAILTNTFVPCNGRFPTLIALIAMFFTVNMKEPLKSIASSLLLLGVIVFGIVLTFLISALLSKTLLKGKSSSFILELPPYRRPQIGKIIIRSVLDRTLFVLGRAVAVAAPAGLIIWLLANISIGNASLLKHITDFMNPFGKLIGMDGVILTAFILGFPANEIVIPVMLMAYLATGSITEYNSLFELKNILTANGWTTLTAVCTMIFSLAHFPCSTTLLTVKKETKSIFWSFISFVLPTLTGIIICFIIATVWRIFV